MTTVKLHYFGLGYCTQLKSLENGYDVYQKRNRFGNALTKLWYDKSKK